MSLASLATELQLHIMDLLDPLSYIRLATSVNKHFSSLRNDSTMAKSFLEREKTCSDIFTDHDVLPCYGCLKAVSINQIAMVDSWALYGNPREDASSNNQDEYLPFASGGKLADERRCKACDEAGGGEFSEYAGKLEDDITRADAVDAAEMYTELGGGYERATGDWSMWQGGAEWSEAEDEDEEEEEEEEEEKTNDDNGGEGFEY